VHPANEHTVHLLAVCILPMNTQCICLLCASCQRIYSASACCVHPANEYTVNLLAVCILPMNIQCICLLCASCRAVTNSDCTVPMEQTEYGRQECKQAVVVSLRCYRDICVEGRAINRKRYVMAEDDSAEVRTRYFSNILPLR
jgi:hypothetical protein